MFVVLRPDLITRKMNHCRPVVQFGRRASQLFTHRRLASSQAVVKEGGRRPTNPGEPTDQFTPIYKGEITNDMSDVLLRAVYNTQLLGNQGTDHHKRSLSAASYCMVADLTLTALVSDFKDLGVEECQIKHTKETLSVRLASDDQTCTVVSQAHNRETWLFTPDGSFYQFNFEGGAWKCKKSGLTLQIILSAHLSPFFMKRVQFNRCDIVGHLYY